MLTRSHDTGATAISFVLALLVFTQANQALKLSFNPNTFVNPVLGRCVWFAAGALLAATGGFLFLLVALEPAKLRGSKPDNSLGETIYGASYDQALVTSDKYLRENERAKSLSGSSRGALAGRRDSRIDADRMSTRSNHTARRSSVSRNCDEEEYDRDDEYVRRPRKAHHRTSSKASRRAAREAEAAQDEEEETETEEERETRRHRKKSVRSRQSGRERRDADESEDAAGGYVDFAGRRA